MICRHQKLLGSASFLGKWPKDEIADLVKAGLCYCGPEDNKMCFLWWSYV